MRQHIVRTGFTLFLLIQAGCQYRSPEYLYPRKDYVYQMCCEEQAPHIYEKEQNGIRVSAMMAVGRGNLLMLSIMVFNHTSRPLTVGPGQVVVALNRYFVVKPLTPQAVINRKMNFSGSQGLGNLPRSIPHSDPWRIGSFASQASSAFASQGQSSKGEMQHMVTERYFKQTVIPPGFAVQGLMYYDPVGYDMDTGTLPVAVIVQIGQDRFDFEFLPQKTS